MPTAEGFVARLVVAPAAALKVYHPLSIRPNQ